MDDQEIVDCFMPLTAGFSDYQWMLDNRPLLAHYTSMQVVEQIMKNEEIWFSNPLFMNDLEEMRFGINQGTKIFEQSQEMKEAAGSEKRAETLRHAFRHFYNQFDNDHAINVFVFCLSQHDANDMDGVLSMWRAYGQHGNGAALVFNTDFIVPNYNLTPIVISQVIYASLEQRITWLTDKLSSWCQILKKLALPDEKLYLAAFQFFNLVKLYALTSKHHGFREEREWRLIYMPDRDPNGVLKEHFSYAIGNRGVEPKLKFKIAPLAIYPNEQWQFKGILDRIILGPSASSPLARISVCKMLEAMGKADFCEKVFSSSIPLRPT